VIAAVDPRTKASAWPATIPCSSTRRWTSAVMSTTSVSPRVEKLSWAVWMAMAPKLVQRPPRDLQGDVQAQERRGQGGSLRRA
jgi:hypothetical protein